MQRRRFLQIVGRGSVWLAVVAGAGPLLGRAVGRRWRARGGRRRRPDDLPPIPWIGHC